MDLGPVCPHLRTSARVGLDPQGGQKWRVQVCRKCRKSRKVNLHQGGGARQARMPRDDVLGRPVVGGGQAAV